MAKTILITILLPAVLLAIVLVTAYRRQTLPTYLPTPSPARDLTPTSQPTSPLQHIPPRPISPPVLPPTDNLPSEAHPTSTITEHVGSYTNDWQTYRNEHYGFEVKFPLNWTLGGLQEIHEAPPLYPKKLTSLSFYVQDKAVTDQRRHSYDRTDRFVGFQLLDPSPISSLDERACRPTQEASTCISSYRMINEQRAVATTFVQSDGVSMGNKERRIVLLNRGIYVEIYSGLHGLPQDLTLSTLANRSFNIDAIASTFRFLH